MQPRRIARIVLASGGLGIGCLSLLGGCGADESRTDGTQVQLTPEDQDFIKSMRGTMKQHRQEARKGATGDAKKKGNAGVKQAD